MNQRNIEELIPIALDYLKSQKPGEKEMKHSEFAIKSSYFGYMASFGPSVTQAGIVKTLAFYEKGGEADRGKIVDFIRHGLVTKGYIAKEFSTKSLLDILSNKIKTKKTEQDAFEILAFTDRILETAIACKLAMNTYENYKEQNEKKE